MKKNNPILLRMAFFCCIMLVNIAFAQNTKQTKTLQKTAIPTTKAKVYAKQHSPQQFLLDQQKNIELQKSVADVVVTDDQIIQGSECVGLDCVNNESFGFDTERLKENNTRIGFNDTSVGAFPSNDWTIVANESASGGASYLAFEDVTGAKLPFVVSAGAATNSLFVDNIGRIGLRTGTPVLDVHMATGNTPGVRLEQNANSGFTAQTWDMAGNEANFFIRDVTGGSRLPFRIRPGAPTSSIDIGVSNVYVKNAILPTSLLPSDERFKKDILSIAEATKIIKSLSPKTYFYDTKKYPDYGFNSNLQYGLIAQEVEKILPMLVNDTKFPDNATFKTLNYIGFIPILIKAMQEQQSEIERLKAKVAHYEELNARMERLEAILNKEDKERKAEKK